MELEELPTRGYSESLEGLTTSEQSKAWRRAKCKEESREFFQKYASFDMTKTILLYVAVLLFYIIGTAISHATQYSSFII